MIDPRAEVSAQARIAANAEIGPWTIIGPDVEIGAGSRIGAFTIVKGPTSIGPDNHIHSFCSIGDDPQDKKFDPSAGRSRLEIGRGNVIREYCSINRGTPGGGGVTRLGDDNWIMAYCHIAHDCQVGNGTVFANNSTLAGHVEIHDHVILGGFTGVHQFVRVGAHSFCGVGTVLLQDLPPFVTVSGNPAKPHGINSEGLKRRGYSAEAIAAIKRAYRTLYRAGLTLAEARAQIDELARQQPELDLFASFIADSGRGLVR